MYKLCFYVPESHLEQVKSAVFAAGAGRVGRYDSSCWQVRGQGQFRPLAGSEPHIGQQDELQHLEEFRVEMVCESRAVKAALQALRNAHPYEEPAFSLVAMVTEVPD